jgi:hypothetical protein
MTYFPRLETFPNALMRLSGRVWFSGTTLATLGVPGLVY